MITTIPIGANTFRRFYQVAMDGSGNNQFQVASFAISDTSFHTLYIGPKIASTTAASAVLVTTTEAHGYTVGQRIAISGMPSAVGGMNGEWDILTVPGTTTFTVGFSSTTGGSTTGVGLTGKDIGSKIPVTNFSLRREFQTLEESTPLYWQIPLQG